MSALGSFHAYQDAPAGQNNLPAVATIPAKPATHLKLKRSQRSGGLTGGKLFFALDARIDVPAGDRELIKKYKLGEAIVYDSEDRQRYSEAAQAHAEASHDNTSMFAPVGQQALGVGKTLYKLGRAGVSAAMAGLALRVTVDSLLAGVHIECKSMQELLEAEKAVITGAHNLKSYLQTAVTFDGREEILEL